MDSKEIFNLLNELKRSSEIKKTFSDNAAVELYKLYQSFINAGFEEKKALEFF